MWPIRSGNINYSIVDKDETYQPYFDHRTIIIPIIQVLFIRSMVGMESWNKIF
ncbi:MAG: hypothetical protein R2809_14440 [Flavobacteriales bacterium]